MIKLGIIGAGRLGSFHADKAAAHDSVELVGVMDTSETARNTIADKHGVQAHASVETLLPAVDAVVIAAPTMLHYALGMPCLRQGKHVLMEKPMCASWSEAQQLVAAAERSHAVFMVGHVEEFNPAWSAAQELLGEVQNGLPALIRAERTSGYTFRSTDVGTVFDMMIHDIDLVLSTVPSRVYSVDATGFNVIGGPHEDSASVRIRFENGTIADLFSSRVAATPSRHMTVTMASGTVSIDLTGYVTAHLPDESVLQGQFAPAKISAQQAAEFAPVFMRQHFETQTVQNDAVDALALEMDDFVRAIETGHMPRVTGRRALAAVALAEKIVESINKSTPLYFSRPGGREAA